MGDIKRKKNKFKRPKKPFDKQRIIEEKEIVKKYGLKNKQEIWKAESEISRLRRMAKSLIPKSEEEKKEFFAKLNRLGFEVKDISDVLALNKEDWLKRRLQTILLKKKLARTIKHARQLITHKLVLVDGRVVNRPGFIVTKDLEDKISLKTQKVKNEE